MKGNTRYLPWKVVGIGKPFYHYIDANRYVPNMKNLETHKGVFPITQVDNDTKEITVMFDEKNQATIS